MKVHGQAVLQEKVLYAFESLRSFCLVLEGNSCDSCHSILTILKFASLFFTSAGKQEKVLTPKATRYFLEYGDNVEMYEMIS